MADFVGGLMSIRAYIERARRAQQDNPQVHPVQLEILESETHDYGEYEGRHFCVECERQVAFVDGVCVFGHTQWASAEEQMERFRNETFEHEIHAQVASRYAMPHVGARASSPNVGGVRSARRIEALTGPIPGRPGWRIDAEGREWYSAAWL